MPLDPFSEYAALRMQQVDGAPDDVTEVHQEIWGIVTPKLPEAAKMSSIKRPNFTHKPQTALPWFTVERSCRLATLSCAEA